MQLDGVTLLVAGCFVAALGAVMLAGAWTQMRSTPALLWWAAGHLVNGGAAAAFAIGLITREPITAIIGSGCIVGSMILYWLGIRVFFHRRLWAWVADSAIAIWVLTSLPFFPDSPRASVAMAFLLTVALLCLACRELWPASEERLVTRWPLMATLALHAAFMGVGLVQLASGNLIADAEPALVSWFGVIHFERLIFLIGSSLFMVLMARERFERTWLAAASIDSLTGVANRSTFFARAERIYRRACESGAPVALIAFDLDHFKAINDTHGHGVGDRVLRAFADTAVAMLRPADLLGRVGGEEFVAILPGVGRDVALLIADRVRHSFGTTPRIFSSGAIYPTVSAGVADGGRGRGLEAVLEEADRALYRAKALGRNRAETTSQAVAPDPVSRVSRVA